MANISKLKLEENTYDIKDSVARNNINNLISLYDSTLGTGIKFTNNGNSVYFTTAVASFSNNVCDIDISSLNLSIKPRCVILTCCNQSLAMQYDYDNSSNTSIRIILIHGGTYSGLIRFSMIFATNE